MPEKNLYLQLIKSSEMQFGKNRKREKIMAALQQTIAEEDLRVLRAAAGEHFAADLADEVDGQAIVHPHFDAVAHGCLESLPFGGDVIDTG